MSKSLSSGKEAPNSEQARAVSGEDTLSPKIDLRDANAMRREIGTVYREMRAGKLAASDGTKLAHVLEIMRRMFETSELEARVELVERQLRTRGH